MIVYNVNVVRVKYLNYSFLASSSLWFYYCQAVSDKPTTIWNCHSCIYGLVDLYKCYSLMLYRDATPIQCQRKWLGFHILYATWWTIWSKQRLSCWWYMCCWCWGSCAKNCWLLVVWLKKGNWLCWTEEPRSYLLYELTSSNSLPYSLLQEG